METGKFQIAAWLSLGIMFIQPAIAAADEPVVGVDGCAIVASVVYTEILADSHLRWPIDLRDTEITICNQLGRAVSRGFSSAMAAQGIHVAWPSVSGTPGDDCDSGDMLLCLPQRHPMVPVSYPASWQYVLETWQAVTLSIAPALARDADSIAISTPTLRSSLAQGLAAKPRKQLLD